MATAIPSSMSFEMLSRLPANSFVQTWKEVRPDQQPIGNVYDLSVSNNIRVLVRGAPNEFFLNTNIYVCGNANLNIVINNSAPTTPAQVARYLLTSNTGLKQATNYFDSSRESFNAGALPYLDNQDPLRSNVITNGRYQLARRNRLESGSLRDLQSATSSPFAKLENCVGDFDQRLNGREFPRGVRIAAQNDATYDLYGNDSKPFQIPLGTYSNFVNSHSVIPIGLLSSYSVNGWQIELKTSVTDSLENKVFSVNNTAGANSPLPATASIASARAYISDIRIFVPIIRVLDPAVMSAVLQLYEKQEMVNIGGVQFPLSLRINSMAYRFANYPLNDAKDYFFRVAGTDRSVRAVAWWIYDTDEAKVGQYNLTDAIRVSRLETHIGSEQIHDVVEDTTENSSNVANFISMNAKRSAALFSPLPYYQEGRKFDGQQDDDLITFNNSAFAASIAYTSLSGATSLYARGASAYGVISMENLDRRESEYSGSFQASGKDLTNVGSIEIKMRIERRPRYTYAAATRPGGAATSNGALTELQTPYSAAPSAPGNNYQIVFAYAYDSVMEVSPSGVMDVTNAVL
jgi:hypothetical protein